MPEVGALSSSLRYNEAARRIATSHRIPFVDLFRALGATDAGGKPVTDTSWTQHFLDNPGPVPVYRPYPNLDVVLRAISGKL